MTYPVNPRLVGTDVPPIPAAQAWAAAYDGRHGPLINLAQAVPGTPPPQALLDRLGAAAARPESAAYGPIFGDLALREAFAAETNRVYGADVGPDEIAITAGCNQAFFVAMLALAEAGDEVILPAPWYFNHKMTLDMLGIVAVPLPCHDRNGFVPDSADARRLIGPRSRAIVLVTPNNPTGAVYPPATVSSFAALAREAGLALVLDETYRDFLPEALERPHDLMATAATRAGLLHLYSFSKSYAVPGHRLGAIVASRDALAEIGKVLDCMTICPQRAAQVAVAWAIEGIAEWRRATRRTVNAQAASFRTVVAASPGWTVAAVGAYFAYVRHPFPVSGEAVAERLARETGVLALPGSFFGPDQERFLRVAFANVDAGTLASVAERLRMLGADCPPAGISPRARPH